LLTISPLSLLSYPLGVEHLQRMLKVLNFSLESIFITKGQADKILLTLKNNGLSPNKPTPPNHNKPSSTGKRN
jgi:hypothetical protein